MAFGKRRCRPSRLSQLRHLKVGVFPVLLYSYRRALWAQVLTHSNSQQLSAWQQHVFCFGSSCVCCHQLLLHYQRQPRSSFPPGLLPDHYKRHRNQRKCFFISNWGKQGEWKCLNACLIIYTERWTPKPTWKKFCPQLFFEVLVYDYRWRLSMNTQIQVKIKFLRQTAIILPTTTNSYTTSIVPWSLLRIEIQESPQQ